VLALDGLSLQVDEGSVFGFLGPNGAGKTTTLRILTGLARATSGHAWVAGQEVVLAPGKRRSPELARAIGYLPEEPAFYPWMTSSEYLDYVGRIFGQTGAQRRERTDGLLKLVDLFEVRNRRIGGLSRGMRQRLGLAQALMNRPRVLFLDEPVSALDPAGRRDVLALIERLRGQCTVLMSSHILADVERVCDTVGILARGRLVVEGKKDELLARYATPAFAVESDLSTEGLLNGWADGLRALPWVASVTVDRPVVRVVASDTDAARRELLPSALRAGLVLTRFETQRPALEDVFLRVVAEQGDQQ
jgi:ABC-2 type transport system ATP-binding protein